MNNDAFLKNKRAEIDALWREAVIRRATEDEMLRTGRWLDDETKKRIVAECEANMDELVERLLAEWDFT